MKKAMTKRMVSVITMLAIVITAFAAAFPASAAVYHNVNYTAGTTENVVGASTFTLACVENANFEFANSKRFSRKGYKLSSWYIKTTGETVGCESTYRMPTYDLDVEAIWTPAVYSIGFAGVGGKTADGSKNFYTDATYGTTMILPENPFTYEGYTFTGWEYAGVTYQAGAPFEIPAVLTGSKIVLAAKWSNSAAAVTTAPAVTTVTTTTTTTTTTEETTTSLMAAANQTIKTFDANYSFTYVNEIYRTRFYNVINNGDIIDKVLFNFSSPSGNIGAVSLTLNATLTNGQTCEKNFAGTVNGGTVTMDLGDTAECNLMGYTNNIQIGIWYSESFPLTLDSITAVVREPEITTTTEETTVTEEETTTTTTTTTTIETTTEAIAEETTTTSTTPFTFMIEGNEETTEVVNALGGTYSRTINVNEAVLLSDVFSLNASELVNKTDVIESMEITIRANDTIGTYNMNAFMDMADGSVFQQEFSGQTEENTMKLTVNVDSAKYMNENSFISVGYWYGEKNVKVTIESIKVNYRVEGDFDNDGMITANDVNLLKQALVGKIQLNGNMDIDGNGSVNVFDSIVLERAI